MTGQGVQVLKWKSGSAFRGIGHRLIRPSDVVSAYKTRSRTQWIVRDVAGLNKVLVTVRPRETWHRLLLLDAEASRPRRVMLRSYFRSILNPENLLPPGDLAAVLATPHPEDYFIGGVVNHEDTTVILHRGDFESVVVPFAWFHTTPGQPVPDFQRFRLTDHGQTVCLGEYEAAADAILFDFDAEVRRRQKSNALSQDTSLGASIRRLRIQRGLSRDLFRGISEKTIARIEHGQVVNPHKSTLTKIARRLGVSIDALGSY